MIINGTIKLQGAFDIYTIRTYICSP